MKKHLTWIMLIAATAVMVALACPVPAQADENKEEVGEEVAERTIEFCGICEPKKHVTQILPWVKVGADHRARWTYIKNWRLQKHKIAPGEPGNELNFQRYRTRVWAKITPMGTALENVDVNVRVVNEFRNVIKPDGGFGDWDRDFDLDETLIDQLNITVNQPMDQPVKLVIGRQDIRLGDGWLVFEGTPLDGSRTIFFDAIRGTIDLKEHKSTVDIIYINQNQDADSRLGMIDDKERPLTNQDEVGAIFYLVNKQFEHTQIDAYFIYKHNSRESAPVPAGGTTDADIYTVGVRLAGDITDDTSYRVEVAPQFGEKERENLNSLGVNSRLMHKLQDAIQSTVFFDYEYRSGDDDPNGHFDILWGRYPQWSEIFNGYADAVEGPPAMSTNLHRFGPGLVCSPMDEMTLTALYQILMGDRNLPAPGLLSDNGHLRGQLLAAIVKHNLVKHGDVVHVKHHFLGELFFPGNFYSHDRNDPAAFARYEILFSW